MKRIAIVYFSHTGVTAQLAQSLKAGINTVSGVAVVEHRILGEEIVQGMFSHQTLLEKLSECDAMLFGSPTYMGGVAAPFKAFCDSTGDLWVTQAWSGKLAGGFTSGVGLNGDQGCTLQYLSIFASQHGMLWVGIDTHKQHNDQGINRLGSQLGVTAQTTGQVHQDDLSTAYYLGQRVAKLVVS